MDLPFLARLRTGAGCTVNAGPDRINGPGFVRRKLVEPVRPVALLHGMSKPSPFRYFKTSPEIIRLAVMLYVRYPLSLRNVEDLLHGRGIEVSLETVRFAVLDCSDNTILISAASR